MQDTTTPVKIGVYVCVLNVGFNVALMRPLQHGGVALATSLVVAPKRGLGGMVLGGVACDRGSMLMRDGTEAKFRMVDCPASTGVQVGGGEMSLERWVSGFTHYLAVERRLSLHTQRVYERDVRAWLQALPQRSNVEVDRVADAGQRCQVLGAESCVWVVSSLCGAAHGRSTGILPLSQARRGAAR